MSESSIVYVGSTEMAEKGLSIGEEGFVSDKIAEGDIDSLIVAADGGKGVLEDFGDRDVARDISRTISGLTCFPSDRA